MTQKAQNNSNQGKKDDKKTSGLWGDDLDGDFMPSTSKDQKIFSQEAYAKSLGSGSPFTSPYNPTSKNKMTLTELIGKVKDGGYKSSTYLAPDITNKIVNEILSDTGDMYEGNFMSTMIEFISYQGFDIAKMRGVIAARGLALRDENDKRQVQLLATEVRLMILIFLHRGNDWIKLMGKMGEEGRIIIGDLAYRYSLVGKLTDKSGTSLTLARVTACFPETACKILSDKNNGIRIIAEDPAIRIYCFSAAPSLFPSVYGEDYMQAIDNSKKQQVPSANRKFLCIVILQWVSWAFSQDDVINGSKYSTGVSSETGKMNIIQFAGIAFRSSVVSEELKSKIFFESELFATKSANSGAVLRGGNIEMITKLYDKIESAFPVLDEEKDYIYNKFKLSSKIKIKVGDGESYLD